MSARVYLLGLIVLATAGFLTGTTIERNSGESRRESAATLRAEGKRTGTAAESKSTLAAEAARQSEGTPATATGASGEATRLAGESNAGHAGERSGKTASETGGASRATHAAEIRMSHAGTGPNKNATHTESSGQHRATHAAAPIAQTGTSTDTKGHAELKPLGVNVEAVPFVVLAAAASLALALAAWVRPRMLLLLLSTAGAMLLFALLDIREVFHQADESRTGLAVLAGVIAMLHLSAVVAAGSMARGARRLRPGG